MAAGFGPFVPAPRPAGPMPGRLPPAAVAARAALSLFRPRLPAVVGQVQPGSAADAAGFRPGDRVKAIDSKSIADWTALATIARAAPGRSLQFEIERNGTLLSITATPRVVEESGSKLGRLGLMAKAGEGEDFDMSLVVSHGPMESRCLSVTSESSITPRRHPRACRNRGRAGYWRRSWSGIRRHNGYRPFCLSASEASTR